MRLFQYWGKNYPVDDVYSLITANTNKLDGYGEVQIHEGGTVEQITQHTARRSIALFIQHQNYNHFTFFSAKFCEHSHRREELVIHW